MLNHNTHTHTYIYHIYLVKIKNINEKIEIFTSGIKIILFVENFAVNLDIGYYGMMWREEVTESYKSIVFLQ